jgi:3-dehydroquinate dehydratase/shikimate dehydrogenase
MAELLAARAEATAGDMVELRLDGVRDLDVGQALHGRSRPAIVTVRPVWEGGRFEGSEEDRRTLLARGLECGAEFVDVEWQAGFADVIARDPARVVVSTHDFVGVPRDLDTRVRAMRQMGGALIKVAVTPSSLADTLPLVDIARGGDAVVIGMGDAGLPSRLLATRFGSRWTYAGGGVAPGQIPARRMIDEFRFRTIGANTALYGVVSAHARHSVSPFMHNAAFTAAGIDAAYVPLQASTFRDFLDFAMALGIRGASVTIPFKLEALRAAAIADDVARAVGAANTLRLVDGRWEATNTDVAGFLDPLEALLAGAPLRGLRVAVLGAGGSARAVVAAMVERGARVTVHARRTEQARELDALGATAASFPPLAGSWDVLVNAMPLGGAGLRDESPLPRGPFTGRLVYDLTYGPGESRLIREARETGCLTLDGLPMLVAQAERQFLWWTGRQPARGVMAAAAHTETGRRDAEARRQHA